MSPIMCPNPVQVWEEVEESGGVLTPARVLVKWGVGGRTVDVYGPVFADVAAAEAFLATHGVEGVTYKLLPAGRQR